MKKLLFCFILTTLSLLAQVTQLPSNISVKDLPAAINNNFAVVPQKFLGVIPPTTITGNLPGDTFTDTYHHHSYVCNAPSGTAAPACTVVATAGWLRVDVAGSDSSASWITCVGTPGNTVGPAGSICVVPTTGVVYACKTTTPTACSTSTDWVLINSVTVDINTFDNAIYCPDTSVTPNTITCNTITTFTSYVAGQTLIVHVANVNSGATAITVNSIAGGSKAVTKFGSTALVSGNLIVTDYLMTYDGTRFQVLNLTLVAADIPGLNYQATISGAPGAWPSFGGAALLNVGTITGTVAAGDDARMTNARTPALHATSHHSGQTDALTPGDIGAATAGASTQVNGQTCALGSSCTISAGGTGNVGATVTVTNSATPVFTCPSSVGGTVVLFKMASVLGTNITSSTQTGCTGSSTLSSQLSFSITEPAGTYYSVVWPTGFSQLGQPNPSYNSSAVTTLLTCIYDGTNCVPPNSASAGPGMEPEIAAPSEPPQAGTVACWKDLTSGLSRCELPSGVITQQSKELTAGNIRVAGGVNAPDTPATVNDLSGPTFCSDAGSNDSYACNLSPAITAYVTGVDYRFKANTANTGAASIAFNSISGAKTIMKTVGTITTTLNDNDILAGQWVHIFYDGTNMQLASPVSNRTNAPLVVGDLPVSAVRHSFGATFDGNGVALTAGKTVYATIPYGCTIDSWDISVDAGTATVDIWKLASGTANPTVTNIITGSGAGRPAITTNTSIHSTVLTGWSTTTVTINDIVAINLQAVATATIITAGAQCQ